MPFDETLLEPVETKKGFDESLLEPVGIVPVAESRTAPAAATARPAAEQLKGDSIDSMLGQMIESETQSNIASQKKAIEEPLVRIPPEFIRGLTGIGTMGLSELAIRPPVVREAEKGFQEGVANLLTGLTSPKAIATLPLYATPYLGPALMAKEGTEAVGTGIGNVIGGIQTKDPRLVGQGISEVGGGAAMAVPGVVHGAKQLNAAAALLPRSRAAVDSLSAKAEAAPVRSFEDMAAEESPTVQTQPPATGVENAIHGQTEPVLPVVQQPEVAPARAVEVPPAVTPEATESDVSALFRNAGDALAKTASSAEGIVSKITSVLKGVLDAIPTRWLLNYDSPRKPLSDFGRKSLAEFLRSAAESKPEFSEAADMVEALSTPATWLGGKGEVTGKASGAAAGMMASFPVVRVSPKGVPSRVLVHEAAHLYYELMPKSFRRVWENLFDTDSLAEIYKRQGGHDAEVISGLEELDKRYAEHGIRAAPVEMFAISVEAADAIRSKGRFSEPSISYYLKPDKGLLETVSKLFQKKEAPAETRPEAGRAVPGEVKPTTEVLPKQTESVVEAPTKAVGAELYGELERKPVNPTAATHAQSDADRAAAGMPPRKQWKGLTNQEAADKAQKIIDEAPPGTDPQSELIKDLMFKPRPIESFERALLLQRAVDLKKSRAYAQERLIEARELGDSQRIAEAERYVSDIDEAYHDVRAVMDESGSMAGSALQASQMRMFEDYSLAGMIREARVKKESNGRRLTETEKKQLVDEVTKEHERITKAQSDEASARTEEAIAETKAQVRKQRAEDEATGTVRDLEAEQTAVVDHLKAKFFDEGEVTGAEQSVRKLMELLVEREGITDRLKMEDRVHEILTKEVDPTLTREQTQDLMSGYGKSRLPNPEFAKKTVRDIAAQILSVRKLLDYFQGKAPKLTGQLRDAPSDIQRGWTKMVNEAKKAFKLDVPVDNARAIKSAIDAINTRLKNRISDLKQEIATRRKIIRERSPSPYNEETVRMRKEVEELQRQRDEILGGKTDAEKLALAEKSADRQIAELERQIKNNEVFPKGSQPFEGTSPKLEAAKARIEELKAQRQFARESLQPKPEPSDVANEARVKSLDKQIGDIEKQLANDEVFSKPKQARTPSEDARVIEREKRLAELKQERQFARERKQPAPEAHETALLNYLLQLRQRAAAIREKTAAGDFSKRVRPERPTSPEIQKAQVELARAKKEFQKRLLQYEMDNRTKAQKAADIFLRIRREFAISRLSAMLVKLPAYSATEFALRPVKDIVSAGLSKVPGIRAIAEKSTSEIARGGIKKVTKEIVNDTVSAFTKGIRDAKDSWVGESELKAQYDPSVRTDAEFKSFFGTLHQMEKSPLIRFNFERSFRRRLESAAANGENIADAGVLQKHGALAYADALDSALVNRNAVVQKVNRFIQSLAEKSKVTGRESTAGKVAGFIAKSELPVLHVPANFVAKTFEYVFGTLYGSARAARVMAKGIETLGPEEANAIMRNLTNGSIGLAAVTAGFLLSDKFGGFWNEARDKKQKLKPGEIQAGDTTIPRAATHNQFINAMQFGATLRQISERKIKNEKLGLSAGAQAAVFGLVDETPYIQELKSYVRMSDPRQEGKFWGERAKSYVIPGIVSETAEMMDKDAQGNVIRRNPQTISEHLKTGLPELRKEVKEKKKQ